MLEMFVVAVVACAIAPAIVMWWWYWDGLNVRVESGVNDDDTAAKTFTDIVRAAKTTLVVHDDGNKMAGTVYDNADVIEAVRGQLANNQALHVRCLFNDREDLDLVRQMRAAYPVRFKVWYRKGPRPPGDIHYKIADGGAFGHLSSHQHGQRERRFKLLDCSDAKPRTRKRVFGKYLAQFENDVAAATE